MRKLCFETFHNSFDNFMYSVSIETKKLINYIIAVNNILLYIYTVLRKIVSTKPDDKSSWFFDKKDFFVFRKISFFPKI